MKLKFSISATALLLSIIAFILSFDAYSLEPNTVKSVKTILKKVEDTDQAIRKEIQEKMKIYKPDSSEITKLWKKQNKYDSENQQIVAEILKNYGWPKVSDYGNIGPAEIIFLVIQHADIEYQKRYFAWVQAAAQRGDLRKSSFALLQDRLLVGEGKKQQFGSQVRIDPKTGKSSLYPIEDEANVDKRRAEVGLQPLAVYAKFFGIDYKPPAGRRDRAVHP